MIYALFIPRELSEASYLSRCHATLGPAKSFHDLEVKENRYETGQFPSTFTMVPYEKFWSHIGLFVPQS